MWMNLSEIPNACNNVPWKNVILPDWDKYGDFDIPKQWKWNFSEYLEYIWNKEQNQRTRQEEAYLLGIYFFPTKQCKPSEAFALWMFLLSRWVNAPSLDSHISVAGIIAYFKALSILHWVNFHWYDEDNLMKEAGDTDESRKKFIIKYMQYIRDNNISTDIADCINAYDKLKKKTAKDLINFMNSIQTDSEIV